MRMRSSRPPILYVYIEEIVTLRQTRTYTFISLIIHLLCVILFLCQPVNETLSVCVLSPDKIFLMRYIQKIFEYHTHTVKNSLVYHSWNTFCPQCEYMCLSFILDNNMLDKLQNL